MNTQTDRAESRETEKITISHVAGELLRIARILKTKADALIKQFGPTIKYGDAMFELMRDAVRESGAVLRVAADEGLLDAAAAKIAATYPSDQVSWLAYLGNMQVHYCGANETALGNPELTAKAIDAVARALLTKVSPEPAAVAAGLVELKQKPARGESESACVACLMKHPHWTNQQIADHVKINPAGITRDRMPQFYRARDAMAGASDDLPRGRKAKRGRNASDDQDIEAEYRKDDGCNAKTDDD